MSNIIEFPIYKKSSPPQSIDDMRLSIAKTRLSFVRNMSIDISMKIFTELEVMGVNIDEDKAYKQDMLLIHEAIKSTLARRVGLSHTLQEYASKMKIENSDITFAFDFGEE
tara:strand:- start:6434 stop:6766 length:333 start_codon:yes stop_codon:yes gene_type:complete